MGVASMEVVPGVRWVGEGWMDVVLCTIGKDGGGTNGG